MKRKKTAVETEKVESSGPQLKKAKTLAEKREFLHEDIMKYGVAAIEKLYPRQRFYQQPASSPVKKVVPKAAVKVSPIKMKPKPVGLDFEEIDARKILRPMSHAKYIKDPDYDYMVYINRKEGLVPLSSLCKGLQKLIFFFSFFSLLYVFCTLLFSMINKLFRGCQDRPFIECKASQRPKCQIGKT